ncbi:MAG: hypothetical protein ACRCZ9_08955 [Fusobacteriaceae bacterium]
MTKNVSILMTDSRNRGDFKVIRGTNYLVDPSVFEGKKGRELDIHNKDVVLIHGVYVTVQALKHCIGKHYEDYTFSETIELIDDLLNYKNKNYSFVLMEQVDNRFKFNKKPCRLFRRFLNVIKNGVVTEIVSIHRSSIGNNGPKEEQIEQLNTVYDVDPYDEQRVKTLSNCTIVDHNFQNSEDQWLLYNINKMSQFKCDNPSIHNGNNVGMKMLEVLNSEDNTTSIEHKMAKAIDDEIFTIETPTEPINLKMTYSTNKLNSLVLKTYLKSKGLEDTLIKDIVSIYQNDHIKDMDFRTALCMAITDGVLLSTDKLCVIMCTMVNVLQKTKLAIKDIVPDNDNTTVISNLAVEFNDKFKEIKNKTGVALGYIHDDTIYLYNVID